MKVTEDKMGPRNCHRFEKTKKFSSVQFSRLVVSDQEGITSKCNVWEPDGALEQKSVGGKTGSSL